MKVCALLWAVQRTYMIVADLPARGPSAIVHAVQPLSWDQNRIEGSSCRT